MGNLLHAPDDQEEGERRQAQEVRDARTEGTYKLQGGKADDGCRSLTIHRELL